ncbi:hypothetical protein BN1013_00288 [Candidatus Rubidus massiliensis]|nr:hypothetical protein BN1013_00288 [Candidatus Rubidus massiliensis]
MNNSWIWKGGYFLLALVAIFFTCKAIFKLHDYYSLNVQIAPIAIEFVPISLSLESYYIKSHYSYIYKNKQYSSDIIFTDYYKNLYAAEKQIEAFKKYPWTIWINSSTPRISTLQKKFPLKELISGGILIGICIYFLGLGYYVKNKL